MHKRIIITNYEYAKKQYVAFAVYEENVLRALDLTEQGKELLDGIFIGRVDRVHRNLNAAFVEITKGTYAYLPLTEETTALYTKKGTCATIAQGDELLVQVVQEPLKEKEAKLSTNLNWKGTYLTLTTGKRQIGVSKKLSKTEREQWKERLLPFLTEQYGFVVRTAASSATVEEVLQEAETLGREFQQFFQKCQHLQGRVLVKEGAPSFIRLLDQHASYGVDEVVTDLPEVYQEIQAFYKEKTKVPEIRFYEDASYDFLAATGLGNDIAKSLRKKVWLKSGGNLFIEQGETLTAIDVNSGKKEKKKADANYFYQLNLEAAQEMIRQVQIRNISGMILVDFVNFREKEQEKAFFTELRSLCKQDPQKLTFVDMTKLGLAEFTRKKVKASLLETLEEKNEKSIDNFPD